MLFSLDDILHGILRGNSHPMDSSRPYFRQNDPRAKFSIERDPRVLFLLATHLPFSPYVRNIETSDSLSVHLECGIRYYIQGLFFLTLLKSDILVLCFFLTMLLSVLLSPLEWVQVAPGRDILLPPMFSTFAHDFGENLDDIVRSWIIPHMDG
jgi:hypothetical protein